MLINLIIRDYSENDVQKVQKKISLKTSFVWFVWDCEFEKFCFHKFFKSSIDGA